MECDKPDKGELQSIHYENSIDIGDPSGRSPHIGTLDRTSNAGHDGERS
jgi:hypothetical protein